MNIHQLQNDKLNIINWISQLHDYSLIEKVKSIMNSSDDCLLTNDQKTAIDEALKSIETNGTSTHKEVMDETRKRFKHLYNR